jgi:hypothetical protein
MPKAVDTGKAAIVADLESRPVGTASGDPVPGVARNAKASKAVYFARNLSHQVERRVPVRVVSALGHVPEDVQAKYHLEGSQIKEMVNYGLGDFDEYEMRVAPAHKVFRVDGEPYLIPAASEKGEPGPWVPIPEALYDLLVGNWEIRNGPDVMARNEHMKLVHARWGGKCIAFEQGQTRQPHQYIELRREEMKTVAVAADKQKVYAGIAIDV